MARRPPKKQRRLLRDKSSPVYQVFVSHATADKWIARVLCEKLEESGATTFRDDRDIAGGDDIPGEIFQQIKRSREIVVVLTPASVNRPWVLLEVGGACCWSRKLRVVAVRCHVEVDAIPDIIKAKKAIHLNELDTYLAEVAARARKQS